MTKTKTKQNMLAQIHSQQFNHISETPLSPPKSYILYIGFSTAFDVSVAGSSLSASDDRTSCFGSSRWPAGSSPLRCFLERKGEICQHLGQGKHDDKPYQCFYLFVSFTLYFFSSNLNTTTFLYMYIFNLIFVSIIISTPI